MLSYLRRRRSRPASPVPGDAVVLMYHSISHRSPDPWRLHVPPQVFAEHLRVIRERYRPVTLLELGDGLAARRLRPRSVAVTFDDGYLDNLEAAVPLLESLGVPATVFVTTGYVGAARDFWWEELTEVCALLGTESRDEWERLRGLESAERERELDRLWSRSGHVRKSPSTVLAWDDLRRLASSSAVEIGAHTRTHPHLSTLGEEQQREEIAGSRRELEEQLETRVTSFSYPHGDASAVTKRLVADAGFTLACTTESGAVSAAADPLALPRLQALSWDAEAFARELDRRLVS